jgi:hypothetical protein
MPATERLYLTAAAGFYEYLVAERLANPNHPESAADPPAWSQTRPTPAQFPRKILIK